MKTKDEVINALYALGRTPKEVAISLVKHDIKGYRMKNNNQFLISYIEVALWLSSDESDDLGGDPLDKNYSIVDLAPETLWRMGKDCEDFIYAAGKLLEQSGLSDEQAGQDFWLTRNGHGCGFWDRGLGLLGEALTYGAEKFGECHLYVGDDKRIYI